MKPTWGIRKLNEYSIDKDTAIIITDTEKDNYYWSDIPDGSLLVNTKTGSLSIKLIGESDWVPMGIRKDGTDKLVKNAVINVEYYVITKIEKEKNQFNYVDSYGITRTGKLANGKVQFKVGSGLYLPGTNQLEILINDVIRCSASDNSLQELNMKYFQIDEDNIRVDSSVTVRYINYERLSELYPLIYTQDEAPWFFEDKDIWINTKESNKEELDVTPLSYTLNYLDNDTTKVELIVFTTKGARLTAAHRDTEYYNSYTTRNITKFKIPRNGNDYYLNLFSTFDSYETAYSKILINGTKSKADKVTIDGEVTYLNNLMSRATVTTQIGNFVSFYRDGKKVYSSQNLDSKVSWNFPREVENYTITIAVENANSGIKKEKTLTIKAQSIENYADINHVISNDGITVTVRTLSGSQITLVDVTASPETIVKTQNVDAQGNLVITIPLARTVKRYRIVSHNEKTDKDIIYNFNVNLHTAIIPLTADQRQHINTNNSEYGVDITYRTEPGSTILIKNSNNQILTRIENTETGSYYIPYDYQFDRTFTVESIKEDKVPESKVVFVPKYEKVNAPIAFTISNVVLENKTWMPKIAGVQGSAVKVEVTTPDTTYVQNTQGGFATSIISDGHQNINDLSYERFEYTYKFKQINDDLSIKFICEHPLYKTQEVTRDIEGLNLREWNLILKDSYVINPYADLFNSQAYQVLLVNFQRMTPDAEVDPEWPLPNSITIGDKKLTISANNVITDEKVLMGGVESYKYFYDTNTLIGKETLTANDKINSFINNIKINNSAYHNTTDYRIREEKRGFYVVFPVENFDDLLVEKEYQFKINNRITNKITVAPSIVHYKNLENVLIDNNEVDQVNFEKIFSKIKKKAYYVTLNLEPKLFKKFIPSIKYIHPRLVNYTSIAYTYNKTEDEATRKAKFNQYFNKLKDALGLESQQKLEIPVSEYTTDKTEYLIFGNTFLHDKLHLEINNKILLFPSKMSYKNYNAVIDKNYFYEDNNQTKNNFIKQAIWLNFSKDKLDLKTSVIQIDRFDDTLSYSDFASAAGFNVNERNGQRNTERKKSDSTSYNLMFISEDTEYIPSSFNSDYNHYSFNSIYYFPELKEADEIALCFTWSKVFFDYSKLNKFHHFAFDHLVYPSYYSKTICVNIGTDNNIYYGDTNVIPATPGQKYYERTTDVYNPSVNDMLILNHIHPFPYSTDSGDSFILNIISKDNKPVGLSSLAFVSSVGMLKINYYCDSITFLDINNNPLSKATMSSQRNSYDKLNRNIDFAKGLYGIPANKYYSYYFSGIFEQCSSIEEIDLRIVTNLYLEYGSFAHCDSAKKIILPSTYLIYHGDYEGLNSTNINYGMFKECRNLQTIENLDNYLGVQTKFTYELFNNCYKLKSDVNINYIKEYFGNAMIDSGIENFVLRKRTVNRDHLGNIVNFDGILEKREKGLTVEPIKYISSAFIAAKNLTQESFDILKTLMRSFKNESFKECRNIKEFVIDDDNVTIIENPFTTPLNKISIKSNGLKVLRLTDVMFNDSEIFKSRDNYKIDAPNLDVFSFETKGGYSTYYSISTPTVKNSFVQQLPPVGENLTEYLKKVNTFLIYPKDKLVSPLSREIPDYGPDLTSKKYVSILNLEESKKAAQKTELTLYNGHLAHIFDKSIKLADIKVERLHVYNYNVYSYYTIKYPDDDYYLSIPDLSFNYYIGNDNDKKLIEKIRWPALKEIVLHGGSTSNYNSGTVLGVNVKYVRD